MSIQSERDKLSNKLELLHQIEVAEKQLSDLRFNHKETESKELDIYQLRVEYNDFSELGKC